MGWDVGSLSGKGGEVCEELIKGMIDVCCLQEVRRRGHFEQNDEGGGNEM